MPKNMAIIFHEGLYYADAKTRNTPQFQPDKHFHSYVWPADNTKIRNRSSGLNDGIAREMGNKVYRTDISRHTYKYLYDKCSTNCDKYKSDEVVIDLRSINDLSNLPGEKLIGDLKNLGWVVVRGVRIDSATDKEIDNVSNMRNITWGGTWHPTSAWGNTRLMKYKKNLYGINIGMREY